ncbi:MAG: PAS domain S-box protein [Bacteroidetes bacterium]|nr:PAS domain S-box protein [Bacteroidota bacterium]
MNNLSKEDLNKKIIELSAHNLELKSSLSEKERELELLKKDFDHLNAFIIDEIRSHIEEIDKLAKIPEENPSPIFRFSKRGRILIYCNGPGQNLLNEIDHSTNSQTQEEWQKAIAKIQENKQPVTYHEINFIDKVYLISIIDVKGSNYKNVYATDITNLKNTEAALRNSEERYKTVIENASDIVYNTNNEGYFTYINPIAEAKIGFTLEDLKNKLFVELIHPDYRKKAIATYYKQKLNKVNSTYWEFPIINKNGETIWLGQNVHLIIRDNKITGFSSIARDISERVKSQTQLKLLNTQLSSLIKNQNSGILLENSERKIVLVNNKFCDIFGISTEPEKLVGYDCLTAIQKLKPMFVNGNKVIEELEKCISDRKTNLNVEVKLINGKILERDYLPIVIDGEYFGHMWQYKDVTEQRSAQEILQKSEEKYRRIIENMRIGLMVTDPNDTIIDVNPSFLELSKYNKEEIIGKPATSIFENVTDSVINLQSVRKGNNPNAHELELNCKDGNKKWVMVSGAPIYDFNKQYIGSIGIYLDITQRKKYEKLLKEAQQKSESSMRSKEIFLANMSHEIRTPMNAILGMSDLLSEANLNIKERSYLNAIKSSSENLLVILNDILDFSKIDSGKMELEAHPFSFNELINNLIIQFEYKITEKNLFLNKEIDNKINFNFNSDSTRLSQILINLLSNAIKFTTEGNVTLKCKLVEEDTKSQLIQFSVEDTGIGIDETKLDTIFDSFIQEDSSINRKFGGSGLGLTISKQLVKLFGGEIHVKSKKGVGSIFTFSIRLQKFGELESNSLGKFNKNPQNYLHFTNTKILLVEDNQMNQLIATTILEKHNLSVTKAFNGQEAIDLIDTDNFDVILMDIQMPVLDGIEATRILRSKKVSIPIIALTANAIEGDKEKYLSAGMNDYISKPFNKVDLLHKIARQLPENKIKYEIPAKDKAMNEKKYNLDRLYKDSDNNQEFVNQMVNLFIQMSGEITQNIQNSIETNNLESVKKNAHKIKSSIMLLGIDSLTPLIIEIEKFDFNSNPDSFILLVLEFIQKLKIIVEEIRYDFPTTTNPNV